MVAFNSDEILEPFQQGCQLGSIVFDRQRLEQAKPEYFSPFWWKEAAHAVNTGGRGSAWYIDAPFGRSVLRHYRRGGMIAWLNQHYFLWQGARQTRSFTEFRLMKYLCDKGLPVPAPLAAYYIRSGLRYRAAILMQRLEPVQSLAQLAQTAWQAAPWEETGHLIARFHRHGLDHADLNAHNILFDQHGQGWLIDLDCSVMRIPATRWRRGNLARLLRSLHKSRGPQGEDVVTTTFARLANAYERAWRQGC